MSLRERLRLNGLFVASNGTSVSEGFGHEDGQTLKALFDSGVRVDPKSGVRIGLELLAILQHVHAAGVVHRNLHPGSVVLDATGHVRLTGFELSKVRGAPAMPSGELSGRIVIMAPEQIVGGEIDERTDLYQFGLILYRLVTGRAAFSASGAWELAKKLLEKDPLAPATVDPTVSWDLSDLVLRALSREKNDRFASAEQLAERLALARIDPWGPLRYIVLANLDVTANGPLDGPWSDETEAAIPPLMTGLRAALAQHGAMLHKAIGADLWCSFAAAGDVIGGLRAGRDYIARSPGAARRSIGYKAVAHYGDCLIEGDELTGDKVSVTARLGSLCPARGVYFSGAAAMALPIDTRDALRLSKHRPEQPNGGAASARLIAGLAPLHEL